MIAIRCHTYPDLEKANFTANQILNLKGAVFGNQILICIRRRCHTYPNLEKANSRKIKY
jgi:hypothetical protein